ncbi:PRK06851 family protein [Rossellomorea marisflavi]|uniref:PRK06851 family protein n=1 Tax=Rossellomorea marisflavi TaxID=189381 RepID=UPI003514BF71
MSSKHYFACGNTAKGLISLSDSAFEELKKVYILDGGPGAGKSTLLKEIGTRLEKKGYHLDYIHSALEPDALDAVLLPEKGIGVIDGSEMFNVAQAVVERVDLTKPLDMEKLADHTQDVLTYFNQFIGKRQEAYDTFAASLRDHDDIEKVYISNMDFEEADTLTGELIDTFFGGENKGTEGKITRRFLGAATPVGAIDHIQNLTEGIPDRFFIKGRAGSGKSTMLKKIAASGREKGFSVEVYHCGFDPNSLDMVILREQGIAIFDSTAPHEYSPSREGDHIVDMYERCITEGTDETYSREIEEATKGYKDKMKEAVQTLKEAKDFRDQMKGIYVDLMDFNEVEQITEELYHRIEVEIQ